MLRVTWENDAGELDAVEVQNEREAAQALIRMVREAGEVHDDDRFYVREVES